MIVFDLKCENNHQFESWFGSSASFEEQKEAGFVVCPFCESHNVTKALMAPNIAIKGNQKPANAGVSVGQSEPESGEVRVAAHPASPELKNMADEARKLMHEMQKHIEKTCDNVGENFADEARKIHYGEADERGIYGSATLEQAKELIDEGVEVMPLPSARRTDS